MSVCLEAAIVADAGLGSSTKGHPSLRAWFLAVEPPIDHILKPHDDIVSPPDIYSTVDTDNKAPTDIPAKRLAG